MDKKIKFRPNSTYFTIALYVIITSFIITLIIKTVIFWDQTSAFINSLISTLSAFFIGIIIAFLMNPLVNWFKHKVFGRFVKGKTLNNTLAITVSYVLVIALIIVAIIFVIPALIGNIGKLIKLVPDWMASLKEFVHNFNVNHPSLAIDGLEKAVGNAGKSITKYLMESKESLFSTIVSTGVSIVSIVIDVVVAIIVSLYLIIDKDLQKRSVKRIIYAVFDTNKAEHICYIIKKAMKIFSSFFSGKVVDSVVLAVLNAVGMLIFALIGLDGFMDTLALITLLIGVTNMIPYFGSYIGSVPSIILLLIYSPMSALVYAIFIIVLMQVDGNIIGPKILGESTGLRPLWIIFAITFGGWVYGIPGMLLGVPVVATISGLIEDGVNRTLKAKEIDMPALKTYDDLEKEKKRLEAKEKSRGEKSLEKSKKIGADSLARSKEIGEKSLARSKEKGAKK